jgi:hypothetical protein
MKNLDLLKEQIHPRTFRHTTICFVNSISEDNIEISFDFAYSWTKVPLTEIEAAYVLKEVELPTSRHPLVRLELNDNHSTVEIAALLAQLDYEKNCNSHCKCNENEETMSSNKTSSRHKAHTRRMKWSGSPLEHCAGEKGCGFWACVYYHAFLK